MLYPRDTIVKKKTNTMMDERESTLHNATYKRRRNRYLLLAFLVLTAILGICAFRIYFDQQWKHGRAVQTIENHWGGVSYEPERLPETVSQILLRKMLGDGFDRPVICVTGRPGAYCRLGDLANLPEIQQLELMDGRVDATGLADLKSLPHLWTLNLWGTNLTDDDLAQVGSLHGLKWLKLGYTRITDKGLEHLKSLRNLRWLVLTGTHVTESGVRKLQTALPDCEIEKEKTTGSWNQE